MFSVYTLYCVLCIYNEDCGRSSVAMCSLMTNSAVACRWGIWPDIDFRCRLDISFQCRADIGNRCRPDVIFDVGLMSSRSVALRRLSFGNCSVCRLDALALSVIATATWLAGWLAGCPSHSGIQKPLFTEINGSKKTEEQIYTRTTKTSYIALAKWLTTSL